MKKKLPEERLAIMAEKIAQTIDRWKSHKQNGCNDPGWPDGVNMNLLRSHVIYFKHQMIEIYEECGLSLPEEYYLPIPPVTDVNFFAKPDSERAIRIIRNFGRCVNNQKVSFPVYDQSQMVLF